VPDHYHDRKAPDDRHRAIFSPYAWPVPDPPRRPKPEPLDPPMVPFAVGGLAAWAVAGVVLLSLRDRLAEQGHTNWLWISLAGFLLGLPGLAVMIRHDAGRQRRRG
jgi:hypothetical protein